MSKLFNEIAVISGLAGGFIARLLGGTDTLLYVLIVIVTADYVTGICKGIMTKTLSSEVGFSGLIKKLLIFCLVAVAVAMSKIIGDTIPLREVVIMFYIANEGLSILENIGEFLPLPPKLKEILIQIRDK